MKAIFMEKKEIIRLAKKDFEKAWVETSETLKSPTTMINTPTLFKDGKIPHALRYHLGAAASLSSVRI